MTPVPPRSTRTYTLFPYKPLFRSPYVGRFSEGWRLAPALSDVRLRSRPPHRSGGRARCTRMRPIAASQAALDRGTRPAGQAGYARYLASARWVWGAAAARKKQTPTDEMQWKERGRSRGGKE